MPATGSWDPLKIPDGLICKNTFFDIPSANDLSLASGPATCPLPMKGWRNADPRNSSSDPTPTFALNDIGATPDWYEGSIFSAMLDPLEASECFDRNDKITTFDLPPIDDTKHFNSDRICDGWTCSNNLFDIPSADDLPPTPCRSSSGNTLPLFTDLLAGTKPFFDIPSVDDPVRTPLSRTSPSSSDPSPPSRNRGCKDLGVGLQDRVNIIFNIPDVSACSTETGPATCPLPTEGWWSSSTSCGDGDEDSSAPTIVSTPTPDFHDVASRSGTDRSSPNRGFDKLLADATADMPDGLPPSDVLPPLPFAPLPPHPSMLLPPLPLPPHPSMLLPPFVPPMPFLDWVTPMPLPGFESIPPPFPWGMGPLLPEMPLPPFPVVAGLSRAPEMPLPAGEASSAAAGFGGLPGPFPETARSSDTSDTSVFDRLAAALPSDLPELPLSAAARTSAETDLDGAVSRGESVLVNLARELGMSSPVASPATALVASPATMLTADAAATSAAADAEAIVLIPSLKVRRRRGSKLAKDPDRGEEPEERLPTFIDVDLGDLVRVKRSRRPSQSSNSEQPLAEQPWERE